MIYDQGALGNANAFYHAAMLLLNRSEEVIKSNDITKVGLYIIPAAVNCAFSCELHLKAMLPIGTRGHKLYTELFTQLQSENPGTAKAIRDTTIQLMCANGKSTYTESDFENDCLSNERVFEQWRYFHEGKQPGLSFNVQFMKSFVEGLRIIAKGENQLLTEINDALGAERNVLLED